MTTHPGQTAVLDQLDAASAEALTTMSKIATARLIGPHQSPWLMAQRAAVLQTILAGPIRLCPHISSGPRVMHAAVWAPATLVCSRCVHCLQPEPGDENLCDHCHHHRPVVHPGTAAIGPILLSYGLCPPCATTTGLKPRKDTPR